MHVRAGYKYQNQGVEHFPYPKWWPEYYKYTYYNKWVSLDDTGLMLKPGFAWNGANSYPDYDWIVVPSAVHDGMLQAHAHVKNDISEDDADQWKFLIDRWFADLAEERAPKWRRWHIKAQLFIGVNYLSRLLPGSQEEDHRMRVYP